MGLEIDAEERTILQSDYEALIIRLEEAGKLLKQCRDRIESQDNEIERLKKCPQFAYAIGYKDGSSYSDFDNNFIIDKIDENGN